ncbi:MAG: hypothetical protein A2X85_03665 [Geobacteraceae bacterium GWF2_54_21]|nr:MAG: hypothetical protein A2X85_03665 [Geobacteraceae bacterium GWF2_54_21]
MIPLLLNIYAEIPSTLPAELIQTLAEVGNVRIERIISAGQATATGSWYDQSWDEWVILLSGSAGLLFEGEQQVRQLAPGDHLLIPAGCRHRVEWTDAMQKTVWLAVHVHSPVHGEIAAG